MKRILLLALMIVLVLSGCSQVNNTDSFQAYDLSEVYTLSKADRNIDYADAQNISLKKDEIYRIEEAGKYVLSGEYTGQIIIDVLDEIVYLQLDNASLRSYNGPAIYVESAAKLVLNLKEGTENVLTDSSYYDGYSEQEACLFSNCDLTINGTGLLRINAYFKDAVRSKDVVKVLDSELDIRAKRNGIRGTDGVMLENTDVTLQCENNGIQTTKVNTAHKGYVAVNSGNVSIIAGSYGIKASENIYLQNCSATIAGVVEQISCDGKQYIGEGCLQ